MLTGMEHEFSDGDTINGNLGFTIKWKKVGNVVVLNFYSNSTAVPAGVDQLIKTLPSEIIPIMSVGCLNTNSTINNVDFALYGKDSPSNEGKLAVHNRSGSTKNYLSGCLTYLA